METLKGKAELSESLRGSVLTIGNFDGVHLGHREIISKLKVYSAKFDLPSVLMTFSPHPREVLAPDKPFSRIFPQRDQVEQISELGVDYLVFEPFSRELSNVSPSRFLMDWIVRPFSPKAIVVGYDFSFGANREGSIDFLRSESEKSGFDLEIVEAHRIDNVIVSSTKIRSHLDSGDVTGAAKMLGRRFYLRGVVVKGEGRGKTIGVPTANLRTPATLLPKPGVYATKTQVGAEVFDSVTNVGRNPTFSPSGTQPNKVETNIFNFDQRVYGEEIRIEFCERIRDELKFSSKEELVDQIKKDQEQAVALLKKG